MLQSYSLFTSEIDDPQAAMADITRQLETLPLCRHSAGILMCHYDFVTNGIVAALVKTLPFPVVGITTFYQTTPTVSGLFELSITVLTSDTVRFYAAGSGMIEDGQDIDALVGTVYRSARDRCGEDPAMLLSFYTANIPMVGDAYLRALDKASGDVPVFGAVATGDDESGRNVFVIDENGAASRGFAVLLLAGDIHPRCYYGSIREERLLETAAVVTQAAGHAVQQLNHEPALAHLRKNGFVLDDDNQNVFSTVPFLYKVPSESRLTARAFGGFDPEREEVFFFGEVPQGATLRVGAISAQDILDVSQAVVRQALEENGDAALLLLFSCVGRYITLGLDTTSEMDYATSVIPAGLPYLAGYVGGELCPISSADGTRINRYHNSSFIVCALA